MLIISGSQRVKHDQSKNSLEPTKASKGYTLLFMKIYYSSYH